MIGLLRLGLSTAEVSAPLARSTARSRQRTWLEEVGEPDWNFPTREKTDPARGAVAGAPSHGGQIHDHQAD